MAALGLPWPPSGLRCETPGRPLEHLVARSACAGLRGTRCHLEHSVVFRYPGVAETVFPRDSG
eukprot:5527360-Alexandrium_andersonii.AAC.1